MNEHKNTDRKRQRNRLMIQSQNAEIQLDQIKGVFFSLHWWYNVIIMWEKYIKYGQKGQNKNSKIFFIKLYISLWRTTLSIDRYYCVGLIKITKQSLEKLLFWYKTYSIWLKHARFLIFHGISIYESILIWKTKYDKTKRTKPNQWTYFVGYKNYTCG